MSDYVRQMPQGSADLARPPSAASRFHVDLPLLLLLLAVTVYGLFVLYSASGQNMAAVQRQGRYFLVAYVVMFMAAPNQPATLYSLVTLAVLLPA